LTKENRVFYNKANSRKSIFLGGANMILFEVDELQPIAIISRWEGSLALAFGDKILAEMSSRFHGNDPHSIVGVRLMNLKNP
jgi:hypothetical protein